MPEIFEIIAAMLAAFGLWNLLRGLRDLLLFPSRIRRRVNAAVYIDEDTSELPEIAAYVKTLSRDGKISAGRLIIIAKGDIIVDIPDSNEFRLIKTEEDSDGQNGRKQ